MAHVNPTIAWYMARSAERAVPPRCLCASVGRCPRFFQSLALMSKAGSTAIDPAEERDLLTFWKRSDLWPVTDEQATAVSRVDDDVRQFSNFCPEVTYERFDFFASALGRYSDDLDRDIAQGHLSRSGVPTTDWRWSWSFVSPMHYTDCPLYSLLVARVSPGPTAQSRAATQAEVLQLKPTFYGVGLDLKVLGRRLLEWLRRAWNRRGSPK